MKNWAENEIRIACKKENPDWDGESFDYGCACYQSALKAYKSLLEDNHSGMSIGFTKNILNRLIEGKPLTPIEDNKEDWNDVTYYDDGETRYQNKRYSALFKHVDKNGNVSFSDVERVVFYDGECLGSHYGKANRFVDDMFPITMPYYPTIPYEVYGELFLSDEELKKYTDWDYEAFYYILTPSGNKIELNKFFKVFECPEKDIDVEITKEEFEEIKNKRISQRKEVY